MRNRTVALSMLLLAAALYSGCSQKVKDTPMDQPRVQEKESEAIILHSENLREDRSTPERLLIKAALKSRSAELMSAQGMSVAQCYAPAALPVAPENTEEYAHIEETGIRDPKKFPLSTFSIDVDVAAYANVRRFLNSSSLPPKDAVRIEEMLNYFDYRYAPPQGSEPFAIHSEIAECPWDRTRRLVHIGIKGKEIEKQNLPPNNLVFLVDVSGSMQDPNKLPLVKSSLRLLVNEMREQDRIALAVYAGSAGLVLPSTSGRHKSQILNALDNLQAGGSTAGGAGIALAYNVAKENFLKEGNNRVILATDGDFNVGVTSENELVRLIEEKREQGIFLTVLGFGMGNYKDSKMEALADKGNGNYAYIDNIREGHKVLVKQMGATLLTIAKDVKIQAEFNPARVKAYRLIGYENRRLKDEEFNDDKKDAGELGAGHTVTALYEVVPVESDFFSVDPLKYQTSEPSPKAAYSDEILTVKLRYKEPQGSKSRLIVRTIKDVREKFESASVDFRFSAAVAGFGMLLKGSEYKGNLTYPAVIEMAKRSLDQDAQGYRAEFVKLAETAALLSHNVHD